MSFGLEIKLDCKPRQAVGTEELYRLVGYRRLAVAIRTRASAAGADDPAHFEVTHRVETAAGGVVEEQLTAAKLDDCAEPLRVCEGSCSGCSANVTGTPFGCILSLSLPLSKAAEEWLAKLVPAQDTLCGQLFRRSAELMKYGDCDTLKEWRQAGFLASAAPVEHEGVTSDMVLHALLMSGDLPPHQSLALLLALGRLTSEGGTADDALRVVERLQTNPQSKDEGLSLTMELPVASAPDPCIEELRAILAGLFRAFTADAVVCMHPQG